MKKLYFLFLIVIVYSGVGQELKQYSFPNLNIQYAIPDSWKVQEYFKNSWEEPGGSSACKCALAINILKIPNAVDFDYIHFVVYPSTKKGQTDEKRKGVWQYKFVPVEEEDTVKTKHLTWLRSKSKFTCIGENRFKDNIVFRYRSGTTSTWYTVYIWAKPSVLEYYQGDIKEILNSIKPINY